MKKKILILALLIFILSIGFASAADDNATDALTLDDTGEVLTSDYEGNFGELADLIDNAQEGDTITLNKNYDGSGSISISKGLTIDGRGHTIDANSESYIFYVEAESDVYLYDIEFTNGYDDVSGGAIYAKSPLYISNCEFRYNAAIGGEETCYGGAIYSKDKLVILNSIFESNYADSGGAIAAYGELYINNTFFSDNYAYILGGAISSYSANVLINASGFDNNTAEYYGASIFAKKTLALTNSTFLSYEDEVEIIDYYSFDEEDESPDFYLYLYNNNMYTSNAYSIWYESTNKLVSRVYLIYAEDKCENGDTIEIARIYDDMGNIIRYDHEFSVKIYSGNTLVDEVELEYDSENNGYFYECDLDNGTYTLTGSLSDEFVADLKVLDGELVVGSSSSGKTTPTVTTSYTKDSSTVVTLTTTVSPSDATGTVTYTINGDEYNPVTVTNGKATKRLSGFEDGTYVVKTSYSGDASYNSANGNQVSFVIASAGVNIDAPELVKYYGGSERFTVTLTEDGEPLSGKTVTIHINGQDYTRTTDTSGKAGMNINLNSAEYPVTVKAEGQEVSSKVTVKPTVSGNDITKIFRNGTQYYATFVDSQGNLLRNTDVKFNINGVFYTRKTDENGVAKMNINLNPGEYVITAQNPSTNEQHTNIINVLTNIIEHNDLTKYYKNDSQYRIRILADDGSIAKAGVKVTFNINGVFYDRYSDDSGYVQMRINLNPGDYIITADYNGLRASNNIKVLNILFGNDVNMEYKDGSKYTVRLLDGHGNPYSGQTIKLNINGVFYDRVTGSDGVASLNINLQPGTYIITATYNGLSCSNNVVVSGGTMVVHKSYGFTIEVPKDAKCEDIYYSDRGKCNVDYADGVYLTVHEDTGTYQGNVNIYMLMGYTSMGYHGNWIILYNAKGMETHEGYVLMCDTNPPFAISSNDLNHAKEIASSFKIVPGCVPDGGSNEGPNGPVIGIKEYDCGNGHKLKIPTTASVEEYDGEEGQSIHGFVITYPDGEAELDIQYDYSDYNSEDRDNTMNYFADMGASKEGYYYSWGILNMNSLTSQGYPQYTMWYGDGYLYSIWADDLNIAKRVSEEFH